MESQITQLLEQLALKLGTTVEYLWAVLVNQAHINSIVTIIELLISWLVWVIIFNTAKHNKFWYHKPKDIYDDNPRYWATLSCLAFAGVILLIGSIVSINTIITGFINPEFWALEKITNMF